MGAGKAGLLITGRPGITVIQGTVTRTGDGWIEVAADLPCGNRGHAVILLKDGRTFPKGAKVVGTCSGSFLASHLLEGGLMPQGGRLVLEGMVIRYTGSFDLPEKGQYPERHVFCGTASVTDRGTDKYGPWAIERITWKRNGKPETRDVLIRGEMAQDLPSSPRVVAMTGAPDNGGGKLYPAIILNEA